MKKALTVTFLILYLSVSFVSFYHATEFFGMANTGWMAVILAGAFEIGQAAVLFSLLADETNSKKVMPWILMCVLTAVQCLGNVFSSYEYMAQNTQTKIQYFTDSILFFAKDPDPQANMVMISYIVGAILPLVALCITGIIVNMLRKKAPEEHKQPTTRFF